LEQQPRKVSGVASTPPEPAPSLSVVVLCYRAGDFAREFVALLEAALRSGGVTSYELCLVANYVEGTDDGTPEVVRALARQNPRIRHVAEPKQGWMGWDMRSGLRLARGAFVEVIDGDGQMPADDVVSVYQHIASGEHDLVMTHRITRGDGPVRQFLSFCFNASFRVLFPGLGVRDVNSKPKILTRAAYERMQLTSDDWFIDAEIVIQARRLGLRVHEIPTTFKGLTNRTSFISMGSVLEFLVNLVRYRLREFRAPRR
jgi:glycosyltransferase involved in cell wall biosynthesis